MQIRNKILINKEEEIYEKIKILERSLFEEKLDQFYDGLRDALKLIGKTIFELTQPQIDEPTSYYFYFWPGYNSYLEKSSHRIFIKDTENDNVDCGIGFCNNNFDCNKKEFFECPSSHWFRLLLGNDVIFKYQGLNISPGGTHPWLSQEYAPKFINSEAPIEYLSIGNLIDEDFNINEGDDNYYKIEDNKISIKLDMKDFKSWGKRIGEVLNNDNNINYSLKSTMTSLRNKMFKPLVEEKDYTKEDLNKTLDSLHNVFGKHFNNDEKHNYPFSLTKKWPHKLSEEENDYTKEDFEIILNFRYKLYSLWLISCFNPELLSNELLNSLGIILPESKKVKDNLDFKCHSENCNELYKFDHWYSTTFRKVNISESESSNHDLGSAMFLTNYKIDDNLLIFIKYWINTIFLTLRGVEDQYIVKKKAKEAEWGKILDEMSHAQKHHLGAIHRRLKYLEGSFNSVDDQFANIFEIQNNLNYLSGVGEYFLNMKREDRQFTPKEESVKIILGECVDIMSNSTDLLFLQNDFHREKIENLCFIQLSESLKMIQDNVYINVVLKGFKIICLDLLKNSLKHTKHDNPIVKLTLIKNENNEYELHFMNNGSIDADAIEFIKSNKDTQMAKSQKIGIRTVKRILSDNNFALSQKTYFLNVKETVLDDTYIDIFITFSEKDVYEKN